MRSEIRQLFAVGRRRSPVVRVAIEDEALPRRVFRSTKAHADEFRGGVAGPQAWASVPGASAAPSLCFGRIGRLSKIRTPGPNGLANVKTTVFASGAEALIGCPPTIMLPP
jgi:hypothetical protein